MAHEVLACRRIDISQFPPTSMRILISPKYSDSRGNSAGSVPRIFPLSGGPAHSSTRMTSPLPTDLLILSLSRSATSGSRGCRLHKCFVPPIFPSVRPHRLYPTLIVLKSFSHPPSSNPTPLKIAVLTIQLTAPPAATRPPAPRYPHPSNILNASKFCTATAHDTPLRTQSTP